MERVVTDGDGLAAYDPELSPQHAVGLQPLACVLYALEQLPGIDGRHVAVIGQGSIGLLFSYAAKATGAGHVIGIDPVDRDGVGKKFGVDTVVRATSDRWVSHLAPNDRPRHRDRSGGPSGRDAGPRDRGGRLRRHRLLLRRRR